MHLNFIYIFQHFSSSHRLADKIIDGWKKTSWYFGEPVPPYPQVPVLYWVKPSIVFAVVAHLPQNLTWCVLWNSFLLTTVPKSGYSAYPSLHVSSDQPSHFLLIALLSKAFPPLLLTGCFFLFFNLFIYFLLLVVFYAPFCVWLDQLLQEHRNQPVWGSLRTFFLIWIKKLLTCISRILSIALLPCDWLI